MQTHVDRLLAPGALTAVFQPIVRVGRRPALFGYEGLIRGPVRSNFEHADVLFGYVRRKQCEEPIDYACLAAILDAARFLPGQPLLNLNVHASTVGLQPDFADHLAALALDKGIDVRRIVIELVESNLVSNELFLLAGVARLRQLGIGVALASAGVDLSTYKLMVGIRPDFFRVGRYLVTGCSIDDDRRTVLSSICRLATAFGSRIIAEGVETDEELECVIDLGIELIQGFLFGRPQPVGAWAGWQVSTSARPFESRVEGSL
jgi:EAL domain-containing protein (putative c-di-GMP-specific phosphodiesterase class I)